MKDLRFTGHVDGDYIDVRFRTDQINSDDENFNITQIQTGQDFNANDKKEDMFQKHFAGTFFGEKNTTLGTCKQFAIDKGLSLRMYNSDGSFESHLIDDGSASSSE